MTKHSRARWRGATGTMALTTCIAVTACGGGGGGAPPAATVQPATPAGPAVTAPPATTPAGTAIVPATTTAGAPSSPAIAALGAPVDLVGASPENARIRLVVQTVTDPAPSSEVSTAAPSGYRFVGITYTIANMGTTAYADSRSAGLSDGAYLLLSNSASPSGQSGVNALTSGNDKCGPRSGVTVAAGATSGGCMIFEVPAAYGRPLRVEIEIDTGLGDPGRWAAQ